MKRIYLILLFIAICTMQILFTVEGQAVNEISVNVNKEKVLFDVPPKIIDGRTMVPIRKVFEKLGFNVEWDQSSLTVKIYNNEKSLGITVGRKQITINGSIAPRELDVTAMVIDGRTLIPIRIPAEILGYSVEYSAEDNRIDVIGEVNNPIFNTNAPSNKNAAFVLTDNDWNVLPTEDGSVEAVVNFDGTKMPQDVWIQLIIDGQTGPSLQWNNDPARYPGKYYLKCMRDAFVFGKECNFQIRVMSNETKIVNNTSSKSLVVGISDFEQTSSFRELSQVDWSVIPTSDGSVEVIANFGKEQMPQDVWIQLLIDGQEGPGLVWNKDPERYPGLYYVKCMKEAFISGKQYSFGLKVNSNETKINNTTKDITIIVGSIGSLSTSKVSFGQFTYTEGPKGSIKIDQGWIDNNITSVSTKYFKNVRVNIKAKDAFLSAFSAIDRMIDNGEIPKEYATLKGGDGTFVSRHVNWDITKPLSSHSWGIAIDINVSLYPSQGKKMKKIYDNEIKNIKDYNQLLYERAFKPAGFMWGGTWSDGRFDPMHFELKIKE